LITLILREAGYNVIEAATGEDAVKIFAEHADRISLLISDVIMPKMNGKDVYDQINRTRPGVKVLFMSGLHRDIIRNKESSPKGFPSFPSRSLRTSCSGRSARCLITGPDARREQAAHVHRLCSSLFTFSSFFPPLTAAFISIISGAAGPDTLRRAAIIARSDGVTRYLRMEEEGLGR